MSYSARRSAICRSSPAKSFHRDRLHRGARSRRGPDPGGLSMHNSGGGWKVYDVVINNASLVGNYRSSFNTEIRQSGIDGLIAQARRHEHARDRVERGRVMTALPAEGRLRVEGVLDFGTVTAVPRRPEACSPASGRLRIDLSGVSVAANSAGSPSCWNGWTWPRAGWTDLPQPAGARWCVSPLLQPGAPASHDPHRRRLTRLGLPPIPGPPRLGSPRRVQPVTRVPGGPEPTARDGYRWISS
jgi:hypothetical protein